MEKFQKLSRAEMKNVRGGGDNWCAGTATCADGTVVSGIFYCGDMTGGSDGDAACGAHGESTSCDCNPPKS